MIETWWVRMWQRSKGLTYDRLTHSYNSQTYTILLSSLIYWRYVIVSNWEIFFLTGSVTNVQRWIHKIVFACTAHYMYVHTLHADFVPLYESHLQYIQNTHPPSTWTSVYSSSCLSWKIRSVNEPLTLACGCTSIWQWNGEKSSIEKACVLM